MSKKVMAVIEISHDELRLKIGEKKGGGFKNTEFLSYPVGLGRDIVQFGKISFENMRKTVDIINGFLQVTEEYGADKTAAIASAVLKKAANIDYISEGIKTKTGLDIIAADSGREKSYIYALTLSMLQKKYTRDSAAVHIGAEGITLSLLENGRFTFTHTVKTSGFGEIFGDVGDEKYFSVIREYIYNKTEPFMKYLPRSLKYIILTGQDADIIPKLKSGKTFGDRSEIFEKAGISSEARQLIIPALAVCDRLLEHIDGDKITALPVTSGDGLLLRLLDPSGFEELKDKLEESSVISAYKIAEKYKTDIERVKNIEYCCMLMFDKLKKLHGLDKRCRFLLRVTAILQDIGRFTEPELSCVHSYNIINGIEIAGISDEERDIIAAAALFNGSFHAEDEKGAYAAPRLKNRALVSKLGAILRLSCAVNLSGKRKYEKIDTKLKENEFIITLDTYKDIELEKIIFENKSELFSDVFGIRAVLKKRSVM